MKRKNKEIWKPVPLEEYGHYQVSSYGRVKGPKGLLRPGKMSRGYLSVQLYLNQYPPRGKSFTVHRLVMVAFYGPPLSETHQVNHKDFDKTNNRVHNLEWCTPKENSQHAAGRGCHSGENNGRAKISNEDRIFIENTLIQRPHCPRVCRELANQFGLNRDYIRQIRLKVRNHGRDTRIQRNEK